MAEKTSKKQKEEMKIELPVSTRGRVFEGTVTKKFPKRVVVEFERTVYIKKYERFYKKMTRLHARLPDSMISEINIGDYIEIMECRPLSKTIHFIVIKKIRSAVQNPEARAIQAKKAQEKAQEAIEGVKKLGNKEIKKAEAKK